MPVSVIRRRGAATFVVEGAAGVRIVSEIRESLLESLAEPRRVKIDLTKATSADVAFAQLIISARRTFPADALVIDDPGGVLAAAFPGAAGAA